MILSYEDRTKLQSVLNSYQQAKSEHEHLVAKRRKMRGKYIFTSVIVIIFICLASFLGSRREVVFIEICKTGTAEEVKTAIAKGIWDVNMIATDNRGITTTPYEAAARHNQNPEVLVILEQAGAKVNRDIALEEAARSENMEVVKFLVRDSAVDINKGLRSAATSGRLEVVNFLLQNGANDINGALKEATESGKMEMIRFLAQKGATDNYALIKVAGLGDIEMVKLLIQNGATSKNEALKEAIDCGNLYDDSNKEVVRFLVQHGASNKIYALEKFVERGDAEMVKFLFQNGAKPESWGKLLRETSYRYSPVNELILEAMPPLTEQDIISVARKYGFEIVADEKKYNEGLIDGKRVFYEKEIARKFSTQGVVQFCMNSICKEEGFILFRSETFAHREYSYWRHDLYLDKESMRSSIRSWLSSGKNKIEGELLDRTVSALMELCYYK